MQIRQVQNNNSYGNFSYLLGCPIRREAVAVDPYVPNACEQEAKRNGWTITAIINTHDHFDHTYGNAELASNTGARLIVSRSLEDTIEGADEFVEPEGSYAFGDEEIRIMFTPGHTMGHVCLLVDAGNPVLISGDTIFNAGVGNCKNGGDPDILFGTIARLSDELPENCLIYPGHNYALKNLSFALEVDPKNTEATRLLAEYENAPDGYWTPSTIGQERLVNPFFRCVRQSKALDGKLAARDEFKRLRQLRDSW